MPEKNGTPQGDPVEFVENLQIAYPEHTMRGFNFLTDAKESGEEGKAESYLNNKSIVSFVANVSGQTRQDVLNSILIAQLAAVKKFPKDEDIIKWFESYKETLMNIGWAVQGKEFSSFKSEHGLFEMENVIIEILTTAFGGAGFIPIVIKTLTALKTMSNANNKILAFEKNTHSLTKGAFVIAVVDETNEAVSMKLGAFVLTSVNEINQILFFKSSSDKIDMQYTSSDCTFQEEVYRAVRQPILAKLGNEARGHVASIDI